MTQEETQDIEVSESTKKVPYYNVDPWKLDEALTAWCREYHHNKSIGLDRPKMSDYIGSCIMKIATGISSRHNFIGYSFRDEMVSDAFEHVIRYVHSYDYMHETKSGNPPAYSYIYRMCWNCFTNRIQEEEKEQIKKYKAIEAMGGVDAFADEDVLEYGEEEKASGNSIISDYMNKIYEYEAGIAAKKLLKAKPVEENAPPVVKNDTMFFFMEEGDAA